MTGSTTTTLHKAIKQHRCTWCWQIIEIGEQYHRYRYFNGGDATTIKLHPECLGAMEEAAAEWGYGDFEWTPGQDRPNQTKGETCPTTKC